MVRNITGLLGAVVNSNQDDETPGPSRESCIFCGDSLLEKDLYARFRVCPNCRFHYSMSARERIDSLIDPQSFNEINRSVTSIDPLSFSSHGSYKQRIFQDQRRTGLTEAVVTGTCAIGGSPAMLIVLDFGFMGGTMGCVVGEKVTLALEQAVKRKLPVIAIVTSGGSRIQEGVLSLMQMAKTSIAASQLNDKGLPFVVVLANPATGQTYASFVNLADIIVSEPGAIVGFSSIRAIKESRHDPLPIGSQTAEYSMEHGLLDGIIERPRLRTLLAVILDMLGTQYRLEASDKRQRQQLEMIPHEAWDSVQLARHKSRPTSSDYISRIFANFVEIHGDRMYGDDEAVICGFGELGGQTTVVIGQERSSEQLNGASVEFGISPEGFRKALRGFKLAQKFGLPLITLIDTPGPDLSLEAEERGMGNAIANTIAQMARLDVPSISVVIGEGGSEAALAFGVADRVLMLENAIYSVISPENAAELMFQDEGRADEAAESLKLTAQDCREYGIIDAIVQEPPEGAHTNPDEAARQLRRAIIGELTALQSLSKRRMIRDRYKKFRKMGEYSSRFRAAILREVNSLQGFVSTGVRRIARRQTQEGNDLPDEQASLESLN